MGGRGSRSAGGGGGGAGGPLGGGGGGGFTITQNADGSATITPAAAQQTLTSAGSGISDARSHTTYFTPEDYAIVSNDPRYGYRLSPRSGQMQPVGYYNTGDYYNINTELREMANNQRTRLSPQTDMVVKAMDRNMQPLNEAIDSTRWTDLRAISDNLGMRGASRDQIIRALSNQDIARNKTDYTSSSWNANANTVAGTAGRNVRIDMHYAKGAKVQFSPTRKEGEMVGARNTVQRFSNARMETAVVKGRLGSRTENILVIDCYVDY